MRFKKFIIIPLLFFIYIFFIVDMLVNFNPVIQSDFTAPSAGAGGIQQIGIGQGVSVRVTREYFGLFRLPVYTNYIGYIGHYHEAFFYSLAILTVIFVIVEIFFDINFGGLNITTGSRGERMGKGFNLKDLGKAFGIGILFAFAILILSGDAGVSIGLGLLIMYLEYKLR